LTDTLPKLHVVVCIVLPNAGSLQRNATGWLWYASFVLTFPGERHCLCVCQVFHNISERFWIIAGPKLGKWIIMPPQLIVMIGLGITYSVTGGSSLHNFYTIVCHKNGMGECHSAGLSVWIIVFSAIHLVIIQVTACHSISFMLSLLLPVSVHALVCSCASVYLSVHASCSQSACCPALAKILYL